MMIVGRGDSMKNNLTPKRNLYVNKKAAAIVAALVVAALAVAAYFVFSAPQPVDAAEFSSFMEAKGFSASDKTGDDGIDANKTEAVVSAIKGDMNVQYRGFTQDGYAEDFYKEIRDAYVSQYQGDLNEKSGKNRESLTFAADFGRYFVVSRIENTVIVAETYNSQSEELNNIIEDIGY